MKFVENFNILEIVVNIISEKRKQLSQDTYKEFLISKSMDSKFSGFLYMILLSIS